MDKLRFFVKLDFSMRFLYNCKVFPLKRILTVSDTIVRPLLDLQETDSIIRDLEREVKDLPIRRAREAARMAGVTASLELARQQRDEHLRRIEDEKNTASAAREKAQQFKVASATASSNRELLQLSSEIDRLEAEADAADARAMGLEDLTSSFNRSVSDAQAKVDEERGGVDSLVEELDQRLAEVKEELKRLETERRALANKVPPQFLLRYERLRLKKWPVVVPLTEEGVCDGCHLVQPPSVAQQVRHNNAIVSCTMCGRVLYRE